MKAAVFVAVLAVVLAVVSCRPDEEKYDDQHTSADVEALLNDKDKLQAVGKCLAETGPCDDEAKKFKQFFSAAIKDECAKCAENLKKNLRQFIFGLKDKEPEIFADIGKHYNPDGQYDAKFKKFFEEGPKA